MKTYATRKEMCKDLLTPGMTIAEIGVFRGDFTEWLAKEIRPTKLYAIDSFEGEQMGNGDQDGYNYLVYPTPILRSFVINRLSVQPAIEFCHQRSDLFFNTHGDGFLDAVYIDGDHSYQGVTQDLEAARWAVRENGWILGHDYDVNPEKGDIRFKETNEGVKRAVQEFCEKYSLEVFATARDGMCSFAVQNKHKYTITLVSYSDREALYMRTFSRFAHYAQKHGYTMTLINNMPVTDRHPSWNKIPLVLQELEYTSVEYIVWMDDDIVLTQMEKPLADFIDTTGFRKSSAVVLASSDISGEIFTHLNAGFLFFKHSIEALHLVDAVWKYGDMNPRLKQGASYEQEAFDFIYRFFSRNLFMIIPQPNFQTSFHLSGIDTRYLWKPGQFAAHINVAGTEAKLASLQLLELML